LEEATLMKLLLAFDMPSSVLPSSSIKH
jgi:hypothetical protein